MTRATTIVLLAALLGAKVAPADTVEKVGDVGAVALPVAGLVAAAAHRDGKGALQLAEAYGSTMAVVYILKPTVNRTRPDGGHDSFPSGHAASAFAGAAFLHIRYGWAYGAPAYALATYVAWSRVHSKQHYTTDVLAGGAIGIAGNVVFTRRFSRMAIAPIAVARGAGLVLDVRW